MRRYGTFSIYRCFFHIQFLNKRHFQAKYRAEIFVDLLHNPGRLIVKRWITMQWVKLLETGLAHKVSSISQDPIHFA